MTLDAMLGQSALSMRNAAGDAAAGRLRAAGADPERLRDAAQEFEGFFLSMMMEQMFAGIETDGPFGGGQGERVFRSMLNQEYGKAIASQGGVGIADTVYRQMLALQEA